MPILRNHRPLARCEYFLPTVFVPAGPLFSSFQYRGGRSLEDRGDLPLAADTSFLHRDSANVLYLDGHVRTVNRQNWVPFVKVPPVLPNGAVAGGDRRTSYLTVPAPPPPPPPSDYDEE